MNTYTTETTSHGDPVRVAGGTMRGAVRIALYGLPWLTVCALGAVGGSVVWAATFAVSAVVVAVLASVPLRSSVTVADDVVVRNGRRVRRFPRSQVVSVVVKDGYGHLVVLGRSRPVRSWALPCPSGVLSTDAAGLRALVAPDVVV